MSGEERTGYLYLENVGRRFGELSALAGVSARVEPGELVSFVGPSGAGKTTLLRILAGLDEPSDGRVLRSREVSRDHPAILVFQDYLLFPHMTVFENVAFGLRSRRRAQRPTREAIRERVTHTLAQLGIADKAEAWPAQLSGGQRQRVAIGRAMVMEPSLLLLDEPFANLDRNLKRETARWIRSLQQRVGVTTIIVSHDLEEASEISDRIGVIIGGNLRQIDSFERVYFHPVDLEVARLFGPVNVLPRQLEQAIAGDGVLRPRSGEQCRCCVRPESLELRRDGSGVGEITDLRLVGGAAHYTVRCGAWEATVRAGMETYRVGDRVQLRARDVFPIDTLPEEERS